MKITLSVRRDGDGAFLINEDLKAGIRFTGWHRLDVFATTLQRMARHVYDEERIAHSPQLTLVHLVDTHQVLIEFNGKVFASLPCHFAIEVSHALKNMARLLEEEAVAQQIIHDQATMMRSGVLPIAIAFSNNPDILHEAVKEAQHNMELRRYIPHRADVLKIGHLRVAKEQING